MSKARMLSAALISLCVSVAVQGQLVLERQVISPLGMNATGSDFTILSTLGQPDYTTQAGTSLKLTWGFEQPLMQGHPQVQYHVVLDECTGRYTVEITKLAGCLTTKDPILWNEEPGFAVFSTSNPILKLDIYGPPGCHYEDLLDLATEVDEITPCPHDIYSLITPNGDGLNDEWILELVNNPEFAQNHVTLFSRWGVPVWSAANYDNHTVVWKGKSDRGTDLTDGTYFYKIEGANRVLTGYVELHR